MYTKALGFLVAAKISDKDTLQYFNTLDKLQVIIQVQLELSQRILVYEPEQVKESLKNIEKVIGKKSMKCALENIDSYYECMLRAMIDADGKNVYDKKYYYKLSRLMEIVNKKQCSKKIK